MSALHKNFIAGEWVAGAGVTRDINPSDTNDVVGEFAQADARPNRRRNRSGPRRISGLVAHDAAGTARRPASGLDRDSRAT